MRELPIVHPVDALAFDLDLAAGGRIQAADQVEQRGLAGTGRAHQGDEVAVRDVQVDAVQHLHLFGAALVGLGEVAEGDEGGHGWFPSVRFGMWRGQGGDRCGR
ncbi:hypothetical protein FQZ97_1094660 [compost metagenome]